MELKYFKPWVGKNYKTGGIFNGKKVMILGESHYGFEDLYPRTINATTEILKKYMAGKNIKDIELWRKFFDRIVKIGSNKLI